MTLTKEQIETVNGILDSFVWQLDKEQIIAIDKKWEAQETFMLSDAVINELRATTLFNKNLLLDLTALAIEVMPKQQAVDENGDEIVQTASLPVVTKDIRSLLESTVTELKKAGVYSVFDAYKNVASENKIALTDPESLASSFQTRTQQLQDINYESDLSKTLLSYYPKKQLTLKGNFPTILKNAKVSVLLGFKPGVAKGEYGYDAKHPLRIIKTPILDENNRLHH